MNADTLSSKQPPSNKQTSPSNRPPANTASPSEEIAAIDLGSNSFHMVTAKLKSGNLQTTDRLQEKVQLADSLTKNNAISPEAFERGLACLSRFAQRIRSIPRNNIRVVGTYALRSAKNAAEFQAAARQILKYPIEIISGREEARLIYLGVAHHTSPCSENRLVIDIGGGSTEFIIGQGYQPLATESLHMGCVSFGRFFPNQTLKNSHFKQAVLAAKQELQSISSHYQQLGWKTALGCSGTIRSIESTLTQNGWSDNGITLSGIERLEKEALKATSCQDIKIPGIREDRKTIFLPGLAILKAAFLQLNIQHLSFADAALREGILFDQLDRQQNDDARSNSVAWLKTHYLVDADQSARVQKASATLFQCAGDNQTKWRNTPTECEGLLSRAAQLHEIGLIISHSQFHKHGAYLVQNADLPGFSDPEQLRLALLIRYHRRKVPAQAFDLLDPRWCDDCWQLMIILRLAVILQRPRDTTTSETIIQSLDMSHPEKRCTLSIDTNWLTQNPLTEADLKQEQQLLANSGWQLEIQ